MGVLWQRAIGLVVLSVLAVLPVSGTVCAALCVPAASATGDHHASATPCHEPVSGQPEVRGTSGHDCDRHNGRAHEATATLTAARVDLSLLSFNHHVALATPSLLARTAVRIHSGSSPPLGTASPTRAPLVLRI